jgi:chemotaxis protein MotB
MKRRKTSGGGSWKVAYADFVTAMMALFLVLWLTSQDSQIKEAVERSFRHPFISLTRDSTGLIPNQDPHAVRSDEGNFDSASVIELVILRKLADDLMKTLESNPEDMDDTPFKVELTPDGLRITLFDRARRPIFEPDSQVFTPYGDWLVSTLAWEVARYARMFTVELEGHTEHGRTPLSRDYGDWEISADRANSARRKLLEHGVVPAQVRKVAGYADTMPMPGYLPGDETNRRIAVLLKIRDDGTDDS